MEKVLRYVKIRNVLNTVKWRMVLRYRCIFESGIYSRGVQIFVHFRLI